MAVGRPHEDGDRLSAKPASIPARGRGGYSATQSQIRHRAVHILRPLRRPSSPGRMRALPGRPAPWREGRPGLNPAATPLIWVPLWLPDPWRDLEQEPIGHAADRQKLAPIAFDRIVFSDSVPGPPMGRPRLSGLLWQLAGGPDAGLSCWQPAGLDPAERLLLEQPSAGSGPGRADQKNPPPRADNKPRVERVRHQHCCRSACRPVAERTTCLSSARVVGRIADGSLVPTPRAPGLAGPRAQFTSATARSPPRSRLDWGRRQALNFCWNCTGRAGRPTRHLALSCGARPPPDGPIGGEHPGRAGVDGGPASLDGPRRWWGSRGCSTQLLHGRGWMSLRFGPVPPDAFPNDWLDEQADALVGQRWMTGQGIPGVARREGHAPGSRGSAPGG